MKTIIGVFIVLMAIATGLLLLYIKLDPSLLGALSNVPAHVAK